MFNCTLYVNGLRYKSVELDKLTDIMELCETRNVVHLLDTERNEEGHRSQYVHVLVMYYLFYCIMYYVFSPAMSVRQSLVRRHIFLCGYMITNLPIDLKFTLKIMTVQIPH